MSVILQFLKELGPVKLAIAGFGSLLFLILFGFFLYRVSSSEMVVLFSDLELQDSNKIVQELESKGIAYEIVAGGTTIKAPKSEVLRLRIAMAQEGIPGKGSIIGYEIFDKEESLGSTSFLQNVKMLRALEGELTRTIESLDQVEKARVHLVIPRKEIFSKERQEPRASVVLRLKGGKVMSKPEIDSISHLVASSVPELEVDNITIIDSKGKSLKLGNKDENNGSYNGSQNDERRALLETKFKRTIEELLERTLGSGKVKAQVNLEMNFDRIVSNSEVYDPEGAVLRSQQTSEEKEKTPTGGEDSSDVSVANNIPGGAQGSSEGGNFATMSKIDDTKNYEISKTITSQIRDSGAIQKLHVAVMVDGTYVPDPKGEKDIYVPRTKDELDKIENIVKVAVGYNETRKDQVQVINMQFAREDTELEDENIKNWLKEQLPSMIQTIVVSVVIMGIFITVVRPIALKAFDIKKADTQLATDIGVNISGDVNAVEPGSATEDVILQISKNNMSSNSTIVRINDIAEQSSQETVGVLKRWLSEEG
ncbi:MAG: flagellar basal-body MS-ring/collar protein FliF [Rickettsiaceae bacterium]|nr:flagellar basal-body MS-ring/collar protein FliF [Rickettsiaceae bacterium]